MSQPQAMPHGPQAVMDRRMLFCERLQAFDTNELLTHCPFCAQFFVLCCHHDGKDSMCHHFRLVFTDGSCFNNGHAGATAGIGVAIGKMGVGEDQWSIPIDDGVDPYPKRTSQRAELLAALEGLRRISKSDGDQLGHTTEKHILCWVVATDSEYAVKGVTEWLPVWKKNNWRTSQGSSPSNRDLFQRLDSMIMEKERKYHVKIGFWHISRQFNGLADSLARRAARSALAT